MTTPTEIVQAMYAAFGAKDEAKLREVLHPDVVWKQCAGMPGGGIRNGVDAVLEKVLGGLNAAWNEFRVNLDRYVAEGDTVIALGHYSGAHAETGKSMTAVFAHVYTVAGGRITRFEQVTDTAEIVAATT